MKSMFPFLFPEKRKIPLWISSPKNIQVIQKKMKRNTQGFPSAKKWFCQAQRLLEPVNDFIYRIGINPVYIMGKKETKIFKALFSFKCDLLFLAEFFDSVCNDLEIIIDDWLPGHIQS